MTTGISAIGKINSYNEQDSSCYRVAFSFIPFGRPE
jgi:hypothetical protein